MKMGDSVPRVPRTLMLGWRWFLIGLLTAMSHVLGAATPIITKYSDINVGSILAGASVGTAILNSPSGTRSITGGTELGDSLTVALGRLTLTGKPGDHWAIRTVSTMPFNLTRIGGGTLSVTAIDFELSTTGTGTFPSSGTTGMFYLGASITVGTNATTPKGTYSGSFTLLLDDTSPAGRSTTAAFSVAVKVDPIITLTKTANLSFGDVFAGASPGLVVLSPNGTRTTTGGLFLGNLSSVNAAGFLVNGAANCTYAIILPTSATLTGPMGTMVVSAFTSTPAASGLLGMTGQQQLDVGATLNVAANQADGDYSGTFAVTVAYN